MKIPQPFFAGNAGHNPNHSPPSARQKFFSLMNSIAIFRSPVSRALVLILLLVPSIKVLGYFRNVRFADGPRLVTTIASQEGERKFGELKVLAEGFHSKITKPFFAVVRDVETYAALRKLDKNLPKLDANFFQANVVVAAFLGERNTGGFSVEITPSPVDINVLEKKPGKGVMVPQIVTSPFKIVVLEGSANVAVRLTLDEAWRRAMQIYRVTGGRFTTSGGIAGTSHGFGLKGVVGVVREKKLATVWLRIVSSEAEDRRLLMECSTGLTDSDNVKISRMSADSFVGPPNSGLSGTVNFSAKGRKLTLTLMARPSFINDGYSGGGTIEADLGTPDTRP